MLVPVGFSICDSSATNEIPSVRESSPQQGRNKLCMGWPLQQQLLFLITMVKGQSNPGSPTLPHGKNIFGFASTQRAYNIWWWLLFIYLFIAGGFALEEALSSVSEILNALCRADLSAAFFMPQSLKLGLTVPFKRGFSSHSIIGCKHYLGFFSQHHDAWFSSLPVNAKLSTISRDR